MALVPSTRAQNDRWRFEEEPSIGFAELRHMLRPGEQPFMISVTGTATAEVQTFEGFAVRDLLGPRLPALPGPLEP